MSADHTPDRMTLDELLEHLEDLAQLAEHEGYILLATRLYDVAVHALANRVAYEVLRRSRSLAPRDVRP